MDLKWKILIWNELNTPKKILEAVICKKIDYMTALKREPSAIIYTKILIIN